MKPSLPTRPTRDPDKISAGWLCRLLDCVEWAMEHPRGDGNTLLNTYGGILRANIKPTSSASSTTMASAPACPAKVVGKQGPFYLVDLHENGTEAMPTRRNVLVAGLAAWTAFVAEICAGTAIALDLGHWERMYRFAVSPSFSAVSSSVTVTVWRCVSTA